MQKKGQLSQIGLLITGGIMLIVVVVILAFGGQFLSSMAGNVPYTTAENNATRYIMSNGTDSFLKMGTQAPNIALVVVLTVIIGLLVFVAYRFMTRR